jgi:hypothetical protein
MREIYDWRGGFPIKLLGDVKCPARLVTCYYDEDDKAKYSILSPIGDVVLNFDYLNQPPCPGYNFIYEGSDLFI